MKPITIDAVEDVGHLCNLLKPIDVLALTAVTIAGSNNNGSGLNKITIPSPTLYLDAQQRAVLIHKGQCFGPDTKILGYSLIIYVQAGSRVYQEDWDRNGSGILESSRKFALSDVVAKLSYKTRQINAWRFWPQRLLTNGRLPAWYARSRLPGWLVLGKLPVELANKINNNEYRRWFRRAQTRAKQGIVK